MKKIVFFLALFSFSMGCFAQQDYEKEINEFKKAAKKSDRIAKYSTPILKDKNRHEQNIK